MIETHNYDAAFHKFTGKEGDSESGLDDTLFRQYSSSLGRWPSPDPAGLAATDPTDPQSWNRYAYVRNNPITRVDPSGMIDCNPDDPFCSDPCWWDPFFCGGGAGGFVGGGGGGGGQAPKPRLFPWPLIPLGLFQGSANGTRTLTLYRATCSGDMVAMDSRWSVHGVATLRRSHHSRSHLVPTST